ncbi:MAG: LPS export ABC transporter periplasmic protein LptC [Candidatus Aerophobetes bacterium]|nr:LPS export ABC transporter periplasmic protein LptC [Candidatus Aerophobetes bacterium]
MRKKNLFVLVAIIIGIISFSLLSSYKTKKEKYPLVVRKENIPLLQAEGLRITGWSTEGEKIWQLKADSAKQFTEKTILNKVGIEFLNNGQLASRGEADIAIMDSSTSNVSLKENIKLISYVDKTELSTSELKWIVSEKKVYTKEKVVLRRGDFVMEGKGLTANPDLTRVEIKEATTFIKVK